MSVFVLTGPRTQSSRCTWASSVKHMIPAAACWTSSSANPWNRQEIPDMLGTLYSFAVDKIDVLVVTPLVTLFLILDTTHPHFPTTVIPPQVPHWRTKCDTCLRKFENRKIEKSWARWNKRMREDKKGSQSERVLGAWGTCVDVIWTSVMRRGPQGPVLIPKAAAWKRALGDYSTFMACRILYLSNINNPYTAHSCSNAP